MTGGFPLSLNTRVYKIEAIYRGSRVKEKVEHRSTSQNAPNNVRFLMTFIERLLWPLERTLEVFVQRFNKSKHIVCPLGRRTYLSVEFRL